MLDHKAYVPMFCENEGEIVTLSCDVLKIDGKYRIGRSECGKKCGGNCVMIHERQLAVARHFDVNYPHKAPPGGKHDDETAGNK